jgi:DNA replication protein DnaC
MIETVKEKLKALKMKACAQHLDQVIETAARKNRPFLETLDHLLDLELEAKRKNRVARLFKESKLTEKLTIDQFEFNFHKSRQKQKTLILDLMQLEFIKQRKDIRWCQAFCVKS